MDADVTTTALLTQASKANYTWESIILYGYPRSALFNAPGHMAQLIDFSPFDDTEERLNWRGGGSFHDIYNLPPPPFPHTHFSMINTVWHVHLTTRCAARLLPGAAACSLNLVLWLSIPLWCPRLLCKAASKQRRAPRQETVCIHL